MEYWSGGVLEYWNKNDCWILDLGILELGVVELWISGLMEYCC